MFRYTPQTIPSNIFVIGGGGTGSRLMPMLSQFLRSITRGQSATGWVESPTIWLIDDDIVETKNLLRQNFIQNDVGKPKAVVLADRYSRAYEVDIIPIVKRVEKEGYDIQESVKEVLTARSPNARFDSGNLRSTFINSIVISCVDSAEARRSILNAFLCLSNNSGVAIGAGAFFIDAGNEDSFGQVNFFNGVSLYNRDVYEKKTENAKLPKMIGSVADINFIPMDTNYYISLQDTVSTASCADLNQTLAINAMMATTIMGIVQNYYYRKPFTYNCVRLSLDGANSTQYNTFNSFLRISLTRDEINRISDYPTSIKEKSGNITTIKFNKFLHYFAVSDIETILRTAIRADEEIARIEREKTEREQRELVEKENRLALRRQAVEQAKTERLAKASTKIEVEVETKPQTEVVPGTTVEVATTVLPLPPVKAKRKIASPKNTVAPVNTEVSVSDITVTQTTTPPTSWISTPPRD